MIKANFFNLAVIGYLFFDELSNIYKISFVEVFMAYFITQISLSFFIVPIISSLII